MSTDFLFYIEIEPLASFLTRFNINCKRLAPHPALKRLAHGFYEFHLNISAQQCGRYKVCHNAVYRSVLSSHGRQTADDDDATAAFAVVLLHAFHSLCDCTRRATS